VDPKRIEHFFSEKIKSCCFPRPMHCHPHSAVVCQFEMRTAIRGIGLRRNAFSANILKVEMERCADLMYNLGRIRDALRFAIKRSN